MNKLWLLFLLVISYQAIHAQEVKHAPTVAQCQADQKLWLSKLGQLPAGAGTANVSYNELRAWGVEMTDCISVDPGFSWQYYNTAGEVTAVQLIRTETFINRHNLRSQFLAEDAQGPGVR